MHKPALLYVLVTLSSWTAVTADTFTWQSRLLDGGVPVDGSADLKFRLYDALTLGNPVGSEQVAMDVQVVDGQVTIDLDFGSVFDGTALWLEIDVRTPHDPTDTAPFTPLSPRQPINPVPYAYFATNVAAGATPFQFSGADAVFTGGNVGIGTVAPAATLHVAGSRPHLLLGQIGQSGSMWFAAAEDGNFSAEVGFINAADSDIFAIKTSDSNSDIRFFTHDGVSSLLPRLTISNGDGNIGIGVTSPFEKLDINGDAKLGGGGPQINPANLSRFFGINGDLSGGDGSAGVIVSRPGLSNWSIFANNVGGLSFFDQASNVMTIEPLSTGGHVGIGTNLPTEQLDVRGDALIQGVPWGTADDESALYLGDTNHSIRSVFGGGVRIGTFGASDAVSIQEGTGHVGIGTLSPTQALDVAGTIASDAGVLVRNPNNLGAQVALNWQNDVSRIRVGGSDPGANNGLDIQGTGNTSLMRILGNGNIGIGETLPSERLEVNGAAKATEFKYQSPKTRYLSMAPYAFVFSDLDPEIGYGLHVISAVGSDGGSIWAPLNLPHGARLRQFRVVLQDGSAAQDMNVNITRTTGVAGLETLVELTTSGTHGGRTELLSPLVDVSIDNQNYYHYVRVSMPNPSWFYGIFITYEIDTPDS